MSQMEDSKSSKKVRGRFYHIVKLLIYYIIKSLKKESIDLILYIIILLSFLQALLLFCDFSLGQLDKFQKPKEV